MRLLPLATELRPFERRILYGAFGFLGLALVVAWAHTFVAAPDGDLDDAVRDGVTSAVYVVSALIVVLRARRVKQDRPAWIAFAIGLVLYAAGNVVWAAWLEGEPNPPIPSISDALWLALYPFTYIGIAWLAWARGRRVPAGVWLDGIVAAFSVTAFGAALVFEPVFDAASGSGTAVAVNLAYPIGDILLAALVVGVMRLRRWRPDRAWGVMGVGFLVLCLADVAYLLQVAQGTSVPSFTTNLIYMAGVVLLALAAWQPRGRAADAPANSWAMLVVPGVASASALALVVYDTVHKLPTLPIVLAALTIAAALGRTALTFRDVHKIDRLKDEILSMVSHEFRTPLTSIRGHVGLLQRDPDDTLTELQQRSLAVIERSSGRLLRLVEDLLLAAEFQSERFLLDRSPIDLAAIAAEALEAAEPTAGRRGVTLVLEADGPATLVADGGRLHQLLDNLVGNAVKFSTNGGEVHVRVERTPRAVRVAVADTGMGIAVAERQRLFHPFSRTAAASQANVPGTGLGLYLARMIVKAHGGTIVLESAEGAGTLVQVELPAGDETAVEPWWEGTSGPPPEAAIPEGSGRILRA